MDIPAHIFRSYVNFRDLLERHADPRTKDWLLLYNSPIYVWLCTLTYIVFVLWIGPTLMKNRSPFQLRGFMIVYNLFLVLLSLYMVVEIWHSAYINNYNPICEPFSSKTNYLRPSEYRMAKVLWWYFFSKLLEFTDTILMVLRKKNAQITVLHVFHHSSMLNIWWFCAYLIPGGQAWFASSINSFVHVFMYTYYLLNLFPSLRKYLWWKRYLTQLQLLQFVMILVHTTNTYTSGCDFPVWSIIMLSSYMLIMLALFGNFYVKSYTSPLKQNGSIVNGKTHDYTADSNNFNMAGKSE